MYTYFFKFETVLCIGFQFIATLNDIFLLFTLSTFKSLLEQQVLSPYNGMYFPRSLSVIKGNNIHVSKGNNIHISASFLQSTKKSGSRGNILIHSNKNV